jgi:arsenate reductase (thioredoxin)
VTAPPLARRLLAELVGTGLLVTAVVGSGVMASRLSPGDVGLQLLENSIATAFALGALILMFGPVSGAHFNPAVSLADWWLGRRTRTGLSATDLGGYVAAQTTGAVGGAVLANLMFALPAVAWSHTGRTGWHLWLGEIVATAGLVLLIFALAGSRRAAVAPAAVGAYIGAAYWFTSSTSFANPAVTVGRAFTDTFAGIAPASVPGFAAAQLLGAVAAAALLTALYPQPMRENHIVTDKPSVLFVCVHNAGRSQMAAGWLRHLAGDAVEVRSAGSAPAESVNPVAVEAMREVGIDLTGQAPKRLQYTTAQDSDVIVTMGCGDACPVFPGKRYEDWQLDDPAGQGIEAVRRIRDDIHTRVEKLLAELLSADRHEPG